MTATLRDWRHAARLFVDNTFAHAPRTKFLYYIVFNVNPSSTFSYDFKNKYGSEINYLAKTVDLPKYEIQNEVLNQYNRKTTAYSKIVYQPVSITLHDDNHGTSNAMWDSYYSHYFQDQNYTTNTGVAPETYKKNTYGKIPSALYGYSGAPVESFFDSIQIITMSKKTFQSYLLCNPKITTWSHDTMDYSNNNGVVENKLTLAYDAVIYDSGTVFVDDPSGFATLHYDKGPSPIADTAPKPNPDVGQDLNLRGNNKGGTFLKPPVSVNYGNNSSLLGSSTPIIPQLLSGNSIYNTGGIQDIGFGGYNTINGFVPASAVGTDIYQGAGSDIFGAPVITSQDFNGSFGGIQGTTGAGTSGNFQSDRAITGSVAPIYNTDSQYTGTNATILNTIKSVESNGNYGAVNYTAVNVGFPKTVDTSNMSLSEVRDYQRSMLAAGASSSAIGPYQTIGSTLDTWAKSAGVSPDTKMTQETWDKIGSAGVDLSLKAAGGDVSKIPLIWYTGNAQGKSSSASPSQVAAYQQKWLNSYDKQQALASQVETTPPNTAASDVDAPLPPRRPEDLGGKPAPEETASTATDNPEQQENPAGETVATNDVNTVSNPEETYQPDASPVETAASEPAYEPDYGSYTFGA